MRVWHQSFTVLEDVPAYAEALQAHLDSRALPGTVIDLHGMKPGTYPTNYPGTHIGYNYVAGVLKEQFVDAALRAQAEGYDAYLIATIPDTGFEECRSLIDIPVVGFGNASVAFAATLAARVGIVNFIDALQPQLRRNMRAYGFGDLVGPIISLGKPFSDVLSGYGDPQPLINAFSEAARAAIEDGAEAVIPGEGPLNVFLAQHGITRVHDVPVIDSLGVALATCEARARLHAASGLKPSRRGFYFATPPAEVTDSVRKFHFGGGSA